VPPRRLHHPPFPRPRRSVSRLEGKLLLFDAHNDAYQDGLSLGRFIDDQHTQWIVALSGKDGRVLWRRPLASRQAKNPAELAFVEGSVIVRSGEHLMVLEAATGALRWQIANVKSYGPLCTTPVYLASTETTPPEEGWDWKTGQTVRLKATSCETIYSTTDAGPNFRYLESNALNTVVAPSPGFLPGRALVPHQGNAQVILGAAANLGSPKIIESNQTKGVDANAQVGVVSRRRWVWKVALSESSVATLPTPPVAAVRRSSVVVPYIDARNRNIRLGAFALARGKRLWDRALENGVGADNTSGRANKGGNINALASARGLDVAVTLNGIVFVRTGDGRLRALTLEMGTPLWSIGGEQ
jgi:outer membrane protein assembly factor BamB